MTIEQLYSIYSSHPVICTDTRNIEPGCLFVCLKGDNFDGNAFATAAIEKGAAFVLTSDKKHSGERIIYCEDTLLTLQQLAAYHRLHLNIPVIGITGTNGKTTTKELLKAVLEKKFKTTATDGNFNNHIGVPLSLLKISQECEIAIIEMGANHPGEIAELCRIASPDHGIITNIGKAHLEGFGSYENIISTKQALYIYVSDKKGNLFVNGDNKLLIRLSEGSNRLLYGHESAFYCTGNLLEADPLLQIQWDQHVIHTQLAGAYNFENVMSAICAGTYFGVPESEIISAIEGYSPSNSRSQVVHTDNNYVILDAYNANPTSMEAALKNFSSMKSSPKAVLLGDMLELGGSSEEEHLHILELISTMAFDKVLLTGPQFSKVCHNSKWHCFSTSEEAGSWLSSHPLKGYTVLVKGSRGIRLEKAVSAL